AIGKTKGGVDRVVVTHFPAKVKLEEWEPEVSFIEQVHIDAHLSDGQIVEVWPKQKKEDKYWIIGYLNSVEIEFDESEAAQALWYEVVIKGFYIPLQSMKLSFSDRASRATNH